MIDDLILYLSRFVALLVVLPAHEFAHGYAAYKNGDNTAKYMGRLTLNPFKHFDLVGLVCFLLAGFGWAKPVPVNPYNFKDFKKGSFWVSIAGVLTNYILAFICYPLFVLSSSFLGGAGYLGEFMIMIFYWGFALDLSFFVFNLIPVYPLDGFRLVDVFAKKRGKLYMVARKYGYYILLGLILLSSAAGRMPQLEPLNIFGYFMKFAINIVGYPITAFWGWIFKLIF